LKRVGDGLAEFPDLAPDEVVEAARTQVLARMARIWWQRQACRGPETKNGMPSLPELELRLALRRIDVPRAHGFA
jgi:hypothetical protein